MRTKIIRQVADRYSFVVLLLIICIVVVTMSACGKKSREKKDSELYVYYTDKEQTKLVYEIYEPKSEETLDIVEELLDKMNTPRRKSGKIATKPDDVDILGYGVYDKTLSIDFGLAYNDMDKITEILFRSSVVLTMTQIEEIDYVSFSVNGESLKLESGEPVGSMSAEDFVDDGASNINSFQKIDVVLYYADSAGEKLEAVDYSGVYDKNTSVEKMIIDRLIQGPTDSQYKRTLPSNLLLRNVLTKDGICYVDFDYEFLNGNVNVSAEMEIYSIVNSLSELSYINKVQISVEGNIDVKLKDSISLEYPFTRNLDIVK
jgi:germination protein M